MLKKKFDFKKNLEQIEKDNFTFSNFYYNKSKKYHKINCDTSLKSYDHAEFKSGASKKI